MALHLVGSCRLTAVALTEHFILQTTGQRLHTGLLGVLSEEVLALCLGGFSLFLRFLLEEGLYGSLCFCVCHLSVGSEHILDSLCEVVDVELCSIHLLQLVPDAHAKGVAYIIHVFF